MGIDVESWTKYISTKTGLSMENVSKKLIFDWFNSTIRVNSLDLFINFLEAENVETLQKIGSLGITYVMLPLPKGGDSSPVYIYIPKQFELDILIEYADRFKVYDPGGRRMYPPKAERKEYKQKQRKI